MEVRFGERQRVATRTFQVPRDPVIDAIVETYNRGDAVHFIDTEFKVFAMKVSTARVRVKRLGLNARVVQSYDPQTKRGVAWTERIGDERGEATNEAQEA